MIAKVINNDLNFSETTKQSKTHDLWHLWLYFMGVAIPDVIFMKIWTTFSKRLSTSLAHSAIEKNW